MRTSQLSRLSPARRRRRPTAQGLERPSPAEIYEDLLDEALRNTPSAAEGRPLKRRRSARDGKEVIVVDESDEDGGKEEGKGKEIVVIEISSSQGGDSDDEEMEWDNVDLTAITALDVPGAESPTSLTIREVTLTNTPQGKQMKKRTPMTRSNKIIRQTRLEGHKMYLLALLGSFRHLNTLLSAPALLKLLHPFIPPAIVNGLKTGPEHTQAQRSIAFLRGLRELVALWSQKWKETTRGWRRPRWVDAKDLGKIPAYLDLTQSISLDMLVQSAKTKAGSRDVGAWLFTSLLRSIGVEARLICSLQPLQFTFLSEGPRQSFHPNIGSEETQEAEASTEMSREKGQINISCTEDSLPQSSRTATLTPRFPSSTRVVHVYSTPTEYIASTQTYSPKHPFFWTEAWDIASQKWIAIDPLVGGTVNQPSKIEPPGSAAHWESGAMGDNILSYVIGFDSAGFARDVTKRYAKAFYAKTWKSRVESQGGELWWTRVINFLDRMEPLDRDQLEDVDLANHVLKEPIPKKRDNFKSHPLYVLERHLKKNEVLAPGAVYVSGFTSGKGMNVKTEYVYKRKDVIGCYSARDWYRRGRIIKEGEQPLKRTKGGNIRKEILLSDDNEAEEDIGTSLYSEPQTELFIPLPVQNGLIPKNAYGNIDIYVPSMIPHGAVHIIRPSIALAAQFAGVDYADAVTGFDFVKRRASARVNGIIVAEENVEGLLVVWEGMMERVVHEEERRRAEKVLERWRRFMVGLEIRKRLEERHGRVEEMVGEDPIEEMDVEGDEQGGFLLADVQMSSSGVMSPMAVDPAANVGEYIHPRNNRVILREVDETSRSGISDGGVINGQNYQQEEDESHVASHIEMDDDFGGGFTPEETDSHGESYENRNMVADDSDEAGGFIYEDEDGIL